MKSKQLLRLLPILGLFALIPLNQSCLSDDIGENFYTFTGDNILTYLEKDTARYSELLKALDKAGMKGLLSSYGTYTFFAPTNEAFRKYYVKDTTSLEQLTRAQLRNILFYHLVPVEYMVAEFAEGGLPTANMKNRYLNITFANYQAGNQVIDVNGTSPIELADQETHNGVVHAVGQVLEPSDKYLDELLADTTLYSIFVTALRKTGMSDSLRMVERENYVQGLNLTGYNGPGWKNPPSLQYGYTAFVESDSVFALAGIHSYEDLIAKCKEKYLELYEEPDTTTNVTNRKNSLNQFVSYHLLEILSYSKDLVDKFYKSRHTTDFGEIQHKEYIPTMRNRSLIEVKTGNMINQYSDGTFIGLSSDLRRINQSCMNGVYHEINKVLWYDKKVEDDVLYKRVRIDINSLIPEFTNNPMRGIFVSYMIPQGYMKYVSIGDKSNLYFKSGNLDWDCYQGDAVTANNWYDIKIQLPPMPPGTWEVRFGITLYDGGTGPLAQGIAQLYFDKNPIGIPIDFSKTADKAVVGWINDALTEDDGYLNDKALRNRGYMKAPDIYGQPSGGLNARDDKGQVRRILGTFNFEDRDAAHEFRSKAIEAKLFGMDFIEFIPKAFIENEDRH